MKTLILYLSNNGQTHKIARFIAGHLTDCCECDVVDLRFASDLDLQRYQRVVIGAAIRYGRFAADLDRFIIQQLDWLHSIPSAFYSVNLTARKPHSCTPITNTYTRKFLGKTPWRPDLCEVFAGALCCSRYCWFDRLMMTCIMRITSDKHQTEVEYTDWDKVYAFAVNLAQLNAKKTLMS